MLSSVLKSPTAVKVNISIMRVFVSMRRFIATNAQLFQRLETMEYHQLEMKQHQEETDKRIDEVFRRLDADMPPSQGVFYDGQVFDAYRFLLIDDEVYHIGASIKDLGKKWFGFTLMRDISSAEFISRLSGC